MEKNAQIRNTILHDGACIKIQYTYNTNLRLEFFPLWYYTLTPISIRFAQSGETSLVCGRGLTLSCELMIVPTRFFLISFDEFILPGHY